MLARTRVNVVDQLGGYYGSPRETGVDREVGSGDRDRMVDCLGSCDGEEDVRGEGGRGTSQA